MKEEEKSNDWADQLEEESKDEGRKCDGERINEVREELHRRLAHEPKGSPMVCKTLYAWVAEEE